MITCRPLPIPVSESNSCISMSLQGDEFMKYSLPPSAYTRLVIFTSLNSTLNSLSLLSKRRDTSAMAISSFLLLKMTSPIVLPLSDLGLCSPSTHEIPSAILLFPLPLGPTITLVPCSKLSMLLFPKDLKPRSVIFLRYKLSFLLYGY